MKPHYYLFVWLGCLFAIPTNGQIRIFRATQPSITVFHPIVINLQNQPDVDLRPIINNRGISIRNQGGRGTCSVHALTFLLEYMYNHCLGINQPDLSEEYLNYVSDKVINQVGDGGFYSDLDKGYQQWGIVPEALATYQSTAVSAIAQSVLNEGKLWSRFAADFVKPWNSSQGASQTQLDKAIQYLDKGIPVAFGGWWAKPGSRNTFAVLGVDLLEVPPTSQKDYKDGKNPMGIMEDGHSVVLVGYKKSASFPGGGYFIFRNSWGTGYGDNGYGFMSFSYVATYANDLMAYVFSPTVASAIGVQAVVAGGSKLDVVVAATDGKVRVGSWNAALNGGHWNAWTPLLGYATKSGTPVSALARDANKLDVFAADASGRVYTAAWDKNVSYAHWRGWWPVQNFKTAPGGHISSVARSSTRLDIFAVGTDGGIYTAAWDANVQNGQWRGYWRIGNLTVNATTPSITAVARDPNKLDVFAIGADNSIFTAAWDAAVQNGEWRGWWSIQNGKALSKGIAAVARDANKLDVCVVGLDQHIWTAAWDASVANGQWRGWWKVDPQ